jgi:hypothetical protein
VQKLSKLEKEIETAVATQLDSLLSERSALAILVHVLPSPRVKKALSTLRQTQDILIGLGRTLIGKEKTLLDGVAYMFWVEVSTNLLADVIIVMLSAKGQPLHIEPDDRYRFIRHATSVEDLESPSVNLAMKLGFLKKCGLSCFDKYVDRELRNRIAHMDFEIDDKGNFFTYLKKNGEVRKKQVDIRQKLDRLTLFNSAVMRQIKMAVDKAKESQRAS